MKKIIMIRGTECGKPEAEHEFNQWYNNVHAPMLFKTGHIGKVARYERVGDDVNYPKYLVIYEFDSQEKLDGYRQNPSREAILKDSAQKSETGEMIVKWRVDYKEIASWGEKE